MRSYIYGAINSLVSSGYRRLGKGMRIVTPACALDGNSGFKTNNYQVLTVQYSTSVSPSKRFTLSLKRAWSSCCYNRKSSDEGALNDKKQDKWRRSLHNSSIPSIEVVSSLLIPEAEATANSTCLSHTNLICCTAMCHRKRTPSYKGNISTPTKFMNPTKSVLRYLSRQMVRRSPRSLANALYKSTVHLDH